MMGMCVQCLHIVSLAVKLTEKLHYAAGTSSNLLLFARFFLSHLRSFLPAVQLAYYPHVQPSLRRKAAAAAADVTGVTALPAHLSLMHAEHSTQVGKIGRHVCLQHTVPRSER